MFDYKSFTIVATFLSLWISIFFSVEIERFLAFILILSFGILHGANDLKLVERKYVNIHKIFFVKILTTYIGFILIAGGLFYFLPSITLLLFILFSAYHFGEEHLSAKLNKNSLLSKFIFLELWTFALLDNIYDQLEIGS
jgi:Brp/Blh family beta-carotene 15,15'-monooxygenase